MKNEVEIIKKSDNPKYKLIFKKVFRDLYLLNNLFLKQKEKVSYYYENLKTGLVLSYNPNITFYAASTIKILVCIYLYEKNIKNPKILDKKLKFTADVKKAGSDIMQNMAIGSFHKIKDLIKYTITVSDNSAYKMLMNYVGVETIKKYGHSLGATTTMEGKDHFGIVNATDYVIYLKKLLALTKEYKKAKVLLNYMKKTTTNKIKPSSVGNNVICRKGGEWDIAYHDCAIIYDKEPFILCVFTQKGQLRSKDIFINKAAKKIYKIHKKVSFLVGKL